MTIAEIAKQIGRRPDNVTRDVAATGHGGVITLGGKGYLVTNEAPPESKQAKWKLTPDKSGDLENRPDLIEQELQLKTVRELEEKAKQERIQKTRAERMLVNQRLRDNRIKEYLKLIADIKEINIELAAEFKESISTKTMSRENIDQVNKALMKWIEQSYQRVSEKLQRSLDNPQY